MHSLRLLRAHLQRAHSEEEPGQGGGHQPALRPVLGQVAGDDHQGAEEVRRDVQV